MIHHDLATLIKDPDVATVIFSQALRDAALEQPTQRVITIENI